MHGEMVTADNDDFPQAGDPVVRRKHSEDVRDGQGFLQGRLGRLSQMQRIYISGERSYLAAIERQQGAFERYADLVESFAGVLRSDLAAVSKEIEKREAEAVEADKKKQALYGEPEANSADGSAADPDTQADRDGGRP
jgi:hypothetical protein